MQLYKKDNHIIAPHTSWIKTATGKIINPTEEHLLANGYEPYEPPTPAPHSPSYDELVEQFIAERYTTSQEIAINRQREEKPDEWQQYYDYCEECKTRARAELNSLE